MNLAPWNSDLWNGLIERLRRGALPHALLLSGPVGVGKRALAEHLVAAILCERTSQAPCGACRSCTLLGKRAQRDPVEERPDGTLAHPDGHGGHPDARFIGYAYNDKTKKMRSELAIDQVRELSAAFVLPPQLGRASVALIDPADGFNHASANALLKTLEEPGEARYILLVSAEPAALPATIRSRCQRISFALPGEAVALQWLAERGVKNASAALAAAAGNPGVALELSRNGGLALRSEVGKDLGHLWNGGSGLVEMANRWAKSDAPQRLWFAAQLVADEARYVAEGLAGPLSLTGPVDFNKLTPWMREAGRTREWLSTPIRAELLILELLSAWRELAPVRRRA
ncbi:MAG: DNA polymerase III subunit delta' [Tahibacter sp.]